jgi:vacuolar-type H+-ATPase subunit I/STV1
MNIQTVRDNLRRTIAGKEHMLDSHKRYLRSAGTSGSENIAIDTTVKFLEININELKRILQDVEKCVFDYDELTADLKEANGRVRQLKQQASDDSWITNPDRMGGGGWTAEELDPNRGWK